MSGQHQRTEAQDFASEARTGPQFLPVQVRGRGVPPLRFRRRGLRRVLRGRCNYAARRGQHKARNGKPVQKVESDGLRPDSTPGQQEGLVGVMAWTAQVRPESHLLPTAGSFLGATAKGMSVL